MEDLVEARRCLYKAGYGHNQIAKENFLILSLELTSVLLYDDVLYAVTPDGVE